MRLCDYAQPFTVGAWIDKARAVARTLSTPDNELSSFEGDVFYPQAVAFRQLQTGSVTNAVSNVRGHIRPGLLKDEGNLLIPQNINHRAVYRRFVKQLIGCLYLVRFEAFGRCGLACARIATSRIAFKKGSNLPNPHAVGHILMVKGANPERDRVLLEIGGMRTYVVVVLEPKQAPAMAAKLVDEEGVSLIELDGGLGPKWTAKVVEAVKGAVPVGAVMFGAESLQPAAKGPAYFVQTWSCGGGRSWQGHAAAAVRLPRPW